MFLRNHLKASGGVSCWWPVGIRGADVLDHPQRGETKEELLRWKGDLDQLLEISWNSMGFI